MSRESMQTKQRLSSKRGLCTQDALSRERERFRWFVETRFFFLFATALSGNPEHIYWQGSVPINSLPLQNEGQGNEWELGWSGISPTSFLSFSFSSFPLLILWVVILYSADPTHISSLQLINTKFATKLISYMKDSKEMFLWIHRSKTTTTQSWVLWHLED